ncbi:MAG: cytochrome c3 family protein [Desulfobacterales bacterium]|nr:cytochrome c3 family protein [Desulfobacterales bacterium]
MLVLFAAFLYSLVGLAGGSNQATESTRPDEPGQQTEFSQPIAFSHKIHIEKGEIPCEFCHIYARRSINSGAPVMASCFGCHRVIAGSDEDPKEAAKRQDRIKKLLEYKPREESIPWKKIHDLPDFVHFSHKRHIQAGFDCTECHGEIDQREMLSMETMITDLSMGWCMKCHREGRQAVDGKIVGPVRKTRGGKILTDAAVKPSDEILLGSKDCYTCHK